MFSTCCPYCTPLGGIDFLLDGDRVSLTHAPRELAQLRVSLGQLLAKSVGHACLSPNHSWHARRVGWRVLMTSEAARSTGIFKKSVGRNVLTKAATSALVTCEWRMLNHNFCRILNKALEHGSFSVVQIFFPQSYPKQA